MMSVKVAGLALLLVASFSCDFAHAAPEKPKLGEENYVNADEEELNAGSFTPVMGGLYLVTRVIFNVVDFSSDKTTSYYSSSAASNGDPNEGTIPVDSIDISHTKGSDGQVIAVEAIIQTLNMTQTVSIVLVAPYNRTTDWRQDYVLSPPCDEACVKSSFPGFLPPPMYPPPPPGVDPLQFVKQGVLSVDDPTTSTVTVSVSNKEPLFFTFVLTMDPETGILDSTEQYFSDVAGVKDSSASRQYGDLDDYSASCSLPTGEVVTAWIMKDSDGVVRTFANAKNSAGALYFQTFPDPQGSQGPLRFVNGTKEGDYKISADLPFEYTAEIAYTSPYDTESTIMSVKDSEGADVEVTDVMSKVSTAPGFKFFTTTFSLGSYNVSLNSDNTTASAYFSVTDESGALVVPEMDSWMVASAESEAPPSVTTSPPTAMVPPTASSAAAQVIAPLVIMAMMALFML